MPLLILLFSPRFFSIVCLPFASVPCSAVCRIGFVYRFSCNCFNYICSSAVCQHAPSSDAQFVRFLQELCGNRPVQTPSDVHRAAALVLNAASRAEIGIRLRAADISASSLFSAVLIICSYKPGCNILFTLLSFRLDCLVLR